MLSKKSANLKTKRQIPEPKDTTPEVASPKLLPAQSTPAHVYIHGKTKSGPDLRDKRGRPMDDSDDSANSGHSGYGSDDAGDNEFGLSLDEHMPKKKGSGKKKKANKSNDVEEFRAQIMKAKRAGVKKRNFEEDEDRFSRKNRSFSNHGRSISLSGAAMLHSGDTKKKGKGKKSKRGGESIYASNVASKSSKASKRSNAFEFFTGGKGSGGGSGGKPKMSVDQEKRKKKYRYGNRNINVIRPSVIPYEEEQEQLYVFYLYFKYILGYDGYAIESRQNMFISHDGNELIYPMARTGIMLNLNNNTQRHWMDAREPISSIAVHPVAPIIVTGHVQKGPDRAKIRVWNYKTLVLHKMIKKMHDAAVLCCQWSKHSGYLYTIGAQEMHKCILWNYVDLFKLDTKHGHTLADGIDHEDILNADVTSKKKNFINCPIDIVSDILLGKQDILGFELNPYISIDDEKDGLIDEFIALVVIKYEKSS